MLLALLNLYALVHPLTLEEDLIGFGHSLRNFGYSLFAAHSGESLCLDVLFCQLPALYS